MKHRLRVLSSADADVDAIVAYLAPMNLESSLRFVSAVEVSFAMISDAPTQWPIYEVDGRPLEDYRKLAVQGFRGFLIFYRVDADMVEIVRVVHASRDIPAILRSELPDAE